MVSIVGLPEKHFRLCVTVLEPKKENQYES